MENTKKNGTSRHHFIEYHFISCIFTLLFYIDMNNYILRQENSLSINLYQPFDFGRPILYHDLMRRILNIAKVEVCTMLKKSIDIEEYGSIYDTCRIYGSIYSIKSECCGCHHIQEPFKKLITSKW